MRSGISQHHVSEVWEVKELHFDCCSREVPSAETRVNTWCIRSVGPHGWQVAQTKSAQRRWEQETDGGHTSLGEGVYLWLTITSCGFAKEEQERSKLQLARLRVVRSAKRNSTITSRGFTKGECQSSTLQLARSPVVKRC
jgi:hypothetical protein